MPLRRAVACPDKFRGTLSATDAAQAMAAGLEAARGADGGRFDDVLVLPLADGGEGTVEVVLAARGGSRRTAMVRGPLGAPAVGVWAVLPDGTAVVESATASGLALVGGHNDPLAATSSGTGELIAAAARAGARRIMVAAGGSAMTDGGLGAVEALGWSLRGLDVVVACDVSATFTDAAPGFAPQKGASPAQVALLVRRLERVAGLYRERTGVDVTAMWGSGAAGGLAGGLAALGARIEGGFEVVARAAGLDTALAGASLVVTGEGRFDASSLTGKVVGGALERAADVPHRAVIAGQVAAGASEGLPPGVRLFSLEERAWDLDEAFSRAATLLAEAAAEAGAWSLSEPAG